MVSTKLRNLVVTSRAWTRRHPAATGLLGAAFVYILCAFYYLGGALTDCHNSLIGGIGDETAGLIWLNSVDHVHPFWGFTHITNYPWGEQLSQPVYATGAAQYLLYWLLAAVSGSVCGFNLLNALGLVSAALVMFGFIRWLTGRPWVALLAGYAVAFTPYLQSKIGVHPSYAFEGLFIGLLWLFLVFWRRPRLKLALWMGALVAVSFYWDPYFILFTSVLLPSLFGAGLGYEVAVYREWRRLRARLLPAAAGLGLVVLLLLPLAFIRLHYAGQINTVVSSSRNAIKFDAQLYSARPLEYLRPVATQPILKALNPFYATGRDHHISNAAEYTINLSLTLIAVVLLAAGLWLVRWLRFRERTLPPLAAPAPLVLSTLGTLGAFAFALSLAPTWHGHHMLSWYLTDYITMWRVFARLSILVNLTLVVLAAIALVYLLRRLSQRSRIIIGLIITSLIALEYQTFVPPKAAWSYRNDVPSIYYRLHDRTDVHVVAEYSLDEQPITALPTFYQTFQRVHGKQLINSSQAASPQASLRGSLRTLLDPQTLPALRTLGADTIVTHGVHQLTTPGLKLIDYEAGPPASASPQFGQPNSLYPIAAYHLEGGPRASYVVAPATGFVYPQMDTPISYEYVGGNGATMQLLPLPGIRTTQSLSPAICLAIRSARPATETASLWQGRQQLWLGSLTSDWQSLNVPAKLSDPVTIKLTPPAQASFMLKDLGCQS